MDGKKAFELEKLHAACGNWGVFQLTNRGMSSSLMNALEEFYASNSPEEKMKYAAVPVSGTSEGYGQVLHGKERNSDVVERFYMTTYPSHKRKSNLFPQLPASLRESLEAYLSELQNLAKIVLLRSIAETLKIEKEAVQEMFDDGQQSVRMNYYPPYPKPEQVTGLAAHSDGAGITIVYQVNGVNEFQVKQDGIWIPVKFLPNALFANHGDIIEVNFNSST